MQVGLHVTCLFLLSDFNQKPNVSKKIAVILHNIIFNENPFNSSYCRHTKQQAAYFAEHVKMK